MDIFNLPNKYSADVRIYNVNTPVTTQGMVAWKKPKGASMVIMTAIGGGGGGGGGFSRTAGTAGGGGGGGACSGISRFICPAIFLPDRLYVQVGAGGAGGAANGNGIAGVNSFIATSKTLVLPNLITYSNSGTTPGGGGAGTVAAGGAGGTAPSSAVVQPCNAWGQWFTSAGLVGGAGGVQTGANGGIIVAWASLPLSPGAGGAGCTTTDFVGGAVAATSVLNIGSQDYYNVTISASGAVAGGNGNPGASRITPLFCSGGSGGGSNNSGLAGFGGAGGYGCGGAGGGAGTTGGAGGPGGGGLVIIISI